MGMEAEAERKDASGAQGRVGEQPIAAGARLRPSADFGRRFIIFADAEEEFDWSAQFQREATSTSAIAALPETTHRFNDAGATPVYLCDYPVVANAASAAIMREMASTGACDIGTQLHPWVNPPFDEAVSDVNSFTGNLPVELQRQKLANLTRQIEHATGVRPTVYRAGRYGLGEQTMALLAEQGYRMDVSVRALFDYHAQGGPDFSDCPAWPWKTPEGIIELPLTAGWTGVLRNIPAIYKYLPLHGTYARTGLLSRVPLTPEGTPIKAALEAIAVLDGEGIDIFSLSFHTPSVVPGFTPYVRNEAELAVFWNWWDDVFNEFSRRRIAPVCYAELIEELGKD